MTLEALLNKYGLGARLDVFRQNDVQIDELPHISDRDLIETFGLTSFMERKQFKAMVASLGGPVVAMGGSTHVPAPTPLPSMAGSTQMGMSAATPALQGETRATGPGVSIPSPTGSPALPARVGSYRVLGLLGAGGMGMVLRARHVEEGWASQQGGDVAVKLIHAEIAASAEFRARFLSEASLGRRFSHPGLVAVYDVIADGDVLAMVMGLVEGEPLTTRVRPGGMGVEEMLSYLRPIGEVLDYLHDNGVVHRDIKPGNIVVRRDGRPVVLDLGIAKADDESISNHTKTAVAMGTSAWMAPEQIDAKRVDGAADRYAFGLMAYALLSGQLPWGSGTTEARLLANKLSDNLVPLASVRGGLPAHVPAAVMKMLHLEPIHRFASCAAFLDAFAAPSAKPVAAVTQPTPLAQRAPAPEVRPAAPEARVEAQAAPATPAPPTKASVVVLAKANWAVGLTVGAVVADCAGMFPVGFMASLLGMTLGIVALVQIQRSDVLLGGKGRSIFSILLGGLGTVTGMAILAGLVALKSLLR